MIRRILGLRFSARKRYVHRCYPRHVLRMNLQDMDLVKEQLRKYKQENYELERELRCRWRCSLATDGR